MQLRSIKRVKHIHGHHRGVWRNEKQLLPVAPPSWALSAVNRHSLIPCGWRHRLNPDFIPARLIGGKRDEFAVGRDLALTGAPMLRAHRIRLLASVQRKDSQSEESQ